MMQRVRSLAASLPMVLALVQAPSAPCLADAPESGEFQVAFVTRLQSMHFTPDSSVLIKHGRAESLQATESGVDLGLYRGRVLLTDPETDPASGRYRVRETLRTPLGSLTWTAVVMIRESGSASDEALGWSRGRITGGSGLFARARGTVVITGRQTACDPTTEEYCAALAGDPGLGERQDFHVILRGQIGTGGGGGLPFKRGR
jgi:hypothetical protein